MKTEHLARIASTLQKALEHLNGLNPDDVLYDVFRNAAIKSFELGLETGGKSLRRALKNYMGSSRVVDALSFNDVLRNSAKYGILSLEESERWLQYRRNRNGTAHDYDERFANETLILLPHFADDLRMLSTKLASE